MPWCMCGGHLGPGDQTQVVSLSEKCLPVLGQLASHAPYFLIQVSH